MEKDIFTPGSALRLPTQPGRPGRIIEAAVYALLAAFFAYASAAELCALAGSLRAFALSLVMLCALALAGSAQAGCLPIGKEWVGDKPLPPPEAVRSPEASPSGQPGAEQKIEGEQK